MLDHAPPILSEGLLFTAYGTRQHVGNRGKWAAQALPFVFGALWLLAMAGAFGT